MSTVTEAPETLTSGNGGDDRTPTYTAESGSEDYSRRFREIVNREFAVPAPDRHLPPSWGAVIKPQGLGIVLTPEAAYYTDSWRLQ